MDSTSNKRWRFRTAVLVGRWRPTIEQAVEDAIAQRQAAREESRPNGLLWHVPGFIEGEADAQHQTGFPGTAATTPFDHGDS